MSTYHTLLYIVPPWVYSFFLVELCENRDHMTSFSCLFSTYFTSGLCLRYVWGKKRKKEILTNKSFTHKSKSILHVSVLLKLYWLKRIVSLITTSPKSPFTLRSCNNGYQQRMFHSSWTLPASTDKLVPFLNFIIVFSLFCFVLAHLMFSPFIFFVFPIYNPVLSIISSSPI